MRKRNTAHSIDVAEQQHWYLLGLDQLIVDIEVHGPTELAKQYGLAPGESVLLDDIQHKELMRKIEKEGLELRISPGGAVGNTVNNFTFLSGEPAIMLGAIDHCIYPGSPSFQYVAKTPMAVDLSHVVPLPGNMAVALTFISPDGERSFAVTPGISSDYPPEAIEEKVVKDSSAAMTTLYCLREETWPIARAARRMMEMASKHGVPVAFGLGTSSLVRQNKEITQEILSRYVTIAAMNSAEAEALTGEKDALIACRQLLELVDMVIITEGPHGLTMGGYVDERFKRETDQPIRSKSIEEYNRWEYSRLMTRDSCKQPLKIYTHIHPYHGGPKLLRNTNGAGDAALAAVLHDVVANSYHRATVPDSKKHTTGVEFLSYSSLSRIAQYGNRVAYEVLKGCSPRLDSTVGSDTD